MVAPTPGVITARLCRVQTIREFFASAAVTLIHDLPCLAVFIAHGLPKTLKVDEIVHSVMHRSEESIDKQNARPRRGRRFRIVQISSILGSASDLFPDLGTATSWRPHCLIPAVVVPAHTPSSWSAPSSRADSGVFPG